MSSAYPPEHPDHPPVPGGYRGPAPETFDSLLKSIERGSDLHPNTLLKLVKLACREKHPLLFAFLQFECNTPHYCDTLEVRALFDIPFMTHSGYFHTRHFQRFDFHPGMLVSYLFPWLKQIENHSGKYLLECLKK